MYKYAIIGCGISGASLARLLNLSGINNFIVYESSAKPGGLCKSINHDNHVLDVGGGHFLCSIYDDVYNFIFSHIPKDQFNHFEKISKIDIDNNIIDYPIEYNLWQLPDDLCIKYLSSLLCAPRSGNCNNYYKWMVDNLGEYITKSYMEPYNYKLWGICPSFMGIDWLHKIPKFDIKAIIKSIAQKKSDVTAIPSHVKFYYPKQGGFQTIFDGIYEPVKQNVRLSTPVTDLKWDGIWTINKKDKAEILINTTPWNDLVGALTPPPELLSHFDNLKYNSITVDLHEEEYEHNWHWLYIPNLNIPHHRKFFIHNYAPHSKIGGIYTETNYNRKIECNPKYSHINKYAYPIPTLGSAVSINSILNHYKAQNLIGLGRWGQWQYYNADVCIKQAIELHKSLVGSFTPPAGN